MKRPFFLFAFALIAPLTLAILFLCPPAHAASMSDFRLGAGDILEVSVWGDEALTRPNVIIRPDGMVSFPLVGDMKAAGKTVEALRKEFEKRIKEYVSDAPVTIMLQQLGSPQVYVVGKVNRPGVYLMSGQITVLQALALAGGMTPYAESDDILVVRIGKEGKQTYLPFNYVKAVSGDGLEQNIPLLPGDTVLIP
ncbi:polysaccharide biosynthesis/export family protein [Pseudodesulfovibrio piezophilus]|uniref:Polysaccharide export protein n=1 Tax=Pseudodesulfovibrio piezophilus (strain DSM 21447 / JCM 15486 / C1TLV30) TaxID=1322246 RepID=M1WU16_PSEP2|nr:polysaccharide biosynthesis/export family protein [Pseudodesulfovibrio piezophilus]CCH50112.1 Polysaccharide export protein [Pseudodesulfovibrio piezophilus C1TLV30]